MGVCPGLEGVALLLPTNLLRGFAAFLTAGDVEGPAKLTMVLGEAGRWV